MPARRVLEGQKAIVTGGSSGIGAGVCLAFAEEGAAVGVNYYSNHRDEAEALVARIREAGGEALALQADVSDEAQVRGLFDAFVGKFGRVDVLVANAGIQKDAPVTEMTLAQWNAVLATNATGYFLCARQAVRHFLAQGPTALSKALGKIICMSSVHQRIPWAGHINYASSKGAVRLFVETLAQEVAYRRIRVNAIAPGAIRTPINRDAWATPEAYASLLKLIPYGRIGEPRDVASAAVWLASDDSDYVTGATLFVDGGMSLYPAFVGNG